MSKHSEACCTIPPVIHENYKPKGDYTTMIGLKTYVTGPKDADRAILMVYDIFGMRDQILQGADILAYADKDRSYQVFMPDFFEGKPADISWYPPDTDEKKEKLGKWFENAAPPKHLPRISKMIEEGDKMNPNIKAWGIIGYCWGGKMVSLVAGHDTKLKAGVQTSPAMVDPEDASKVKIPMCMLASKDEEPEVVEKYKANLKVKHYVDRYHDQLHGWMSARADLKDEKVKSEYERGYKAALEFFHEHFLLMTKAGKSYFQTLK